MLMYLARYGHQNAMDLQDRLPSSELMSWVRHMGNLLDEEHENSKR